MGFPQAKRHSWFLEIILFDSLSCSKVSKNQVPFLVEKQISWLNVSVDNIFASQVAQYTHKLANIELFWGKGSKLVIR